MTADDAIRRGASALPKREGLPDPQREARWLLAAAWDRDEAWLRVHGDETLPPEVDERYRDWIERRAAGEPAHHLVGSCSFFGRSFQVSPAVLVPRSETELLVQRALALELPEQAQVLDVGTGSGCIAISLATERPRWQVTATDCSPEALEIAQANARSLAVAVHFVASKLGDELEGPFALVTANLPYIPSAALSELPLEVQHDPALALDGGPDGLDLVRELIKDLPRLLAAGGWALLELYEGQAAVVAELAAANGLTVADTIRDLGGAERVVVLRRPE